MWPFKKKPAEHALRELVENLSQALGQKLLSVILYGSKASGEYHEDHSDVNVFILLENTSADTLGGLLKPIRAWLKAGHPMPVFIQQSELQIYANNLPIEFLDMKDHHKVIFGANPLQSLNVDRRHLRAQCAQELSVKLLKLRQMVLLMDGNTKRLRAALVDSLPSILTLFRAALRLDVSVLTGNKMEAAQELAQRAEFDSDCLKRLSESAIRRDTDNIKELAQHYLDTIGRVLAYVSK